MKEKNILGRIVHFDSNSGFNESRRTVSVGTQKTVRAVFFLTAAILLSALITGCAMAPDFAGNDLSGLQDLYQIFQEQTPLTSIDEPSTKEPSVQQNADQLLQGREYPSIEEPDFDNPMIEQRADPYVIYNEDDGCYYFTSSWPAYNDAEHGYDRIALRKSPTLSGLRDAEDHIIWKAHPSGAQSHHVWAPELHKINGSWYIYYATTCNSDIWSIRPYVLQCSDPDDLLNSDKWIDKGRFLDKDGKESGFFGSFSLDMTCFENKGKHYVIWAYKGFYPGALPGSSVLLMAELSEDEPWKLSSDPILLSKPEYDWEQVNEKVNEGPAVLKYDGKIYVTYSASATGPEYCIGLLSADEKSDLMDPASWQKSEKPVLSSEDFTDQYGPGHNSFTVDELGNTIIVYHSRDQRCFDNKCDWADADPLYDPCRNANFGYVRFASDKTPIFKQQ